MDLRGLLQQLEVDARKMLLCRVRAPTEFDDELMHELEKSHRWLFLGVYLTTQSDAAKVAMYASPMSLDGAFYTIMPIVTKIAEHFAVYAKCYRHDLESDAGVDMGFFGQIWKWSPDTLYAVNKRAESGGICLKTKLAGLT